MTGPNLTRKLGSDERRHVANAFQILDLKGCQPQRKLLLDRGEQTHVVKAVPLVNILSRHISSKDKIGNVEYVSKQRLETGKNFRRTWHSRLPCQTCFSKERIAEHGW